MIKIFHLKMDVHFEAEDIMDAFDQLAIKYMQLAKGEEDVDSIFIGPSHVTIGVDEKRLTNISNIRSEMYSRQKEDRMEKAWCDIGWHLVEDTGRRTQGLGDKIVENNKTGLTVVADHKSTRNEKQLTIKKEQLIKIKEEAKDYGYGIPAITFTYFDHKEVYVVFNIKDLKGVLE